LTSIFCILPDAKRYSDSPEIAKVFNAVKDYLLYARNESQEYIFHDLMLREIKAIRPDAILIDTLKFSGPVDTDFIFWNILDRTDVFVKYDDTRHCHMSQEKHYILYEMIEDSIKTGKEIDHSRLSNVKPSKTFEDYFKIQDNKLEFILVEKFKEQFK
jgi:hypothetical protein